MADLTIQEYLQKLASSTSETEKMLMRSHFDLASAILHKAQDNVKATFGASGHGAGKPRSSITRRSDGGTAGSSGRSGALFRSGMLEWKDQKTLSVVFGGTGVPYAVVHEKGAVIRPRKPNGWLTIPFAPAARGKRAREFELQMAWDEDWGPVLEDGAGEIYYLLRRKATIPARPYLSPAVKAIMNDKHYKAIVKRIFADSGSIKFEVT